ncbi:MAG: LemA family protein [Prevotellaceae bacterium]|nr:LemA family protein [Prevotellaceae bacterium]
MSTGVIILIVVIIIAIWAVSIYNNLVNLRNNRENAFANIDVQLRQRYDLVPQLVATVKGYATHERELLERVTAARTAAMSATGINDKISAESQLSSALAGLKVSMEAYPDLKANQNFIQLQGELSDIENKLAATRRFFNSSTKELNTAVQSFPANILASMFGFHTEPMFEIAKEERDIVEKAPTISF